MSGRSWSCRIRWRPKKGRVSVGRPGRHGRPGRPGRRGIRRLSTQLAKTNGNPGVLSTVDTPSDASAKSSERRARGQEPLHLGIIAPPDPQHERRGLLPPR
jgi:hypothetical protein